MNDNCKCAIEYIIEKFAFSREGPDDDPGRKRKSRTTAT